MSIILNNTNVEMCYQERRDIAISLLNVLTLPDRDALSPDDVTHLVRGIQVFLPSESDMAALDKITRER